MMATPVSATVAIALHGGRCLRLGRGVRDGPLMLSVWQAPMCLARGHGGHPAGSSGVAGGLPQPRGFQGLAVVEVVAVPDDLAVPELGQTRVGRVEVDSALSTSTAGMTKRNHPIPQVAKL